MADARARTADREAQAAAQLAAIRATAAARTGWEPWMTDVAGFGACLEDAPICAACGDAPPSGDSCRRCGRHG